MSSVPISNPPEKLGMNTFKAVMDDKGGLQRSSRFAIRILPTGSLIARYDSQVVDKLMYLVEIGEMPGRGFMNMDVRYYGPNHKLPYQSVYEDINMTIICRNGSFEKEFFDDWLETINPTTFFDFNYRDEYTSSIEIFQFGELSTEKQQPVADYKVTLHHAYPIFINPQPMTWGDTLIQKLVVNFTYTHWTRDKDVKPRTGLDGYSFSLVEGREILR